MKRYLLCVVVVMALSGLMVAPALADSNGNPNPGVIPLEAKVGGLTHADWADRYNQWFWSVPRSVDLLASPGVGQDPTSPVFFLPSASGDPVEGPIALEGSITVPADKILLLPVAWAVGMGPVFSLDCCPMTAEEVFACAPLEWGPWLDSMLLPEITGDLYASVDGQSLQSLAQYRVQSAMPFSQSMPADNIFGELECGQGGFAGLAMSDGYWLMLTPLPAGEHTITFGCANLLHTTLYVTVLAEE